MIQSSRSIGSVSRLGARLFIAAAVHVAALPLPAGAQIQIDPDEAAAATIELAAAARRAVEAPYLSEEERRDKRLFHGVWSDADLDTPARRALAACIAGDWLNAVFDGSDAPVLLQAERLLAIGETDTALALLDDEQSPTACRLRAEALDWNGQFQAADAAIDPVVAALEAGELASAVDLTEAARCLALRARLRGEPASQYSAILTITSRVHQTIDRLYWPAKLVEAELLADKNNPKEAAAAATEVLTLNPRCAEAWAIIGQLNLDSYNFAGADSVVQELDRLAPDHIGARLLLTRLDLVQGMADSAEQRVNLLLREMPRHRDALALRAAVEAIRYDEDGLHLALRDFEEISGRNPWAWYTAGLYLSSNRQYDFAAEILGGAIERQPNWPAPQVELGLMYLQSGNDEGALSTLRQACALDPFNVRAAFSLHLIESLQQYETIASEHFEIRFDPQSPDRALAIEMLEPLEAMHHEITTALHHAPDRPTRIELMPNHSRFAVRISGLPQIHTIAACTGPVIAMEAPREGPDHFGTYNWLRVLRHEYVHTVTLSQTKNRIPHWLTEAAAVWLEDAPRDFGTCQMLARASLDDDLFTLDEINWAFVRPKRPNDRSLAYAQGHWMVEFMIERFGHAAFLELLDQYAQGFREDIAIPSALGVGRMQFYEEFLSWAGAQVQQWGMAPEPSLEDIIRKHLADDPEYAEQRRESQREYGSLIARAIRAASKEAMDPVDMVRRAMASVPDPRLPRPTVSDGMLDRWLELYPDHPDLLRMRITRWRGSRALGPDMIPVLDRYAAARPVDPLPQQMLAAIHLESNQPEKAIPYLESINRLQKYDDTYAVELARLYQQQSRFDVALDRIDNAVHIAPYDARLREQAAAIAIQARDLDDARRHLVALTLLEPDREQHAKRLEALDRMMQPGQ
ncbi:MAG: hypothetical protein IT430_09640 [Phycisphaerales bacterium]|nr:hypothetical protein [Phycisphaerales bacterium]